MSPANWNEIDEVLQSALDVPTTRRRAWVAARCEGDAELLHEVEELLEAESASKEFLFRPVAPAVSRLLLGGDGAPADARVGPYLLVRELGRGGMGVVYEAVRADGKFNQRVAVKFVGSTGSADLLKRFEQERQILASLDHPNIARLLDGGQTVAGAPYLVMEYVEGLPLLRHCDERGLTTEERLKLFAGACSAVQHAHRHLVVHRDIKPSNIIVTQDGVPKLLDFGIAKLLDPVPGGGADAQTETALRVMTPEYASPEQLLGGPVTTATDIYSLGVVIYELLTGAKPYRLKNATSQELYDAIREQPPTKPSDVASRRRSSASERQGPVAPIRNPKSLRGDLDNIILMALRKEPERRYRTVEQFSADIERHLKGLPVAARRDTFAYRSSKFVRRNKVATVAAGLLMLTLLGGSVTTNWQARRVREQRDRAQAAQTRAEKLNAFMQTIFAYANPHWFGRASGRRDVTVLEAMRDIEKRIDKEFRDEPDLRADVYQQIGDSYRTQELFDDAERNLRAALRLRLELYGEDSAKVAESMFILSGVRFHQGDFGEQELLLTKALSIQRRHPVESNNLPYMMADYANLLETLKNDYAGALALGREALELFRGRYGESHYMVGATQNAIARFNVELGDYALAEAMAREHFKQRHPPDFSFLGSYAHVQIVKGDYRLAENVIAQMLAQARSPEAKPYMMSTIYGIRHLLAYQQGDYAQAVADAEQMFTAQPDGDTHDVRALFLARALNRLGQVERAEAILREAIVRLGQSERAYDLAKLNSALGESLTAQRRFAEAEKVMLAAYEAQKSRVLPGEYYFVETRRQLAALYSAWGKADEALKYD